jgi:hypothetical protein
MPYYCTNLRRDHLTVASLLKSFDHPIDRSETDSVKQRGPDLSRRLIVIHPETDDLLSLIITQLSIVLAFRLRNSSNNSSRSSIIDNIRDINKHFKRHTRHAENRERGEWTKGEWTDKGEERKRGSAVEF